MEHWAIQGDSEDDPEVAALGERAKRGTWVPQSQAMVGNSSCFHSGLMTAPGCHLN